MIVSVAALSGACACDLNDIPPSAPVDRYVPTTYAATASRDAGDYFVDVISLHASGAGENEKRFAARIFYPYGSRLGGDQEKRALAFFDAPNPTVVIWSNGMAGVDCEDKYRELLEHWASYGFLVVQEGAHRKMFPRLVQRWPFGKRAPRETYERFSGWLRAQWRKSGRPGEIPKFNVIVGGKSRGGSQSHASAREQIFDKAHEQMIRRPIDGLICIAGCGFPGSAGVSIPSLYVTGENDRVGPVNARKNVCRAFLRGKSEGSYFERRVFERSDWKHAFGTHHGHDNDPLIRLLTTDWLRCRRDKDDPACDRMNSAKSGEKTWTLVALNRSALPEDHCR